MKAVKLSLIAMGLVCLVSEFAGYPAPASVINLVAVGLVLSLFGTVENS